MSQISISQVHMGADLSPEAVEFGKAMERYKRQKQRPHPTAGEVLAVLLSLGYRRVQIDTEPQATTAGGGLP